MVRNSSIPVNLIAMTNLHARLECMLDYFALQTAKCLPELGEPRQFVVCILFYMQFTSAHFVLHVLMA